eukprot:TRINITY_DN21001_c0_g1_i1.p1 TRINITY_DN21001_c0_g1~~TRINITY_DN21001_c0_g1_i1.p1  ORF type:complete len:145 (+),score=18.76 TRINITY_DN21001_c0_g1_i1:416-850(+)
MHALLLTGLHPTSPAQKKLHTTCTRTTLDTTMVRCCTFALSAAALLAALLTTEAGRLSAEYKIRNLAGPGIIGPLTQACPGQVGDCAGDPACLLCVQQIDETKVTADAIVGQTCEGALAVIQAVSATAIQRLAKYLYMMQVAAI